MITFDIINTDDIRIRLVKAPQGKYIFFNGRPSSALQDLTGQVPDPGYNKLSHIYNLETKEATAVGHRPPPIYLNYPTHRFQVNQTQETIDSSDEYDILYKETNPNTLAYMEWEIRNVISEMNN